MSQNYQQKVFTTAYYDYEKNGSPISAVGHLKQNINYWKAIGCSDYIVNVIEKGYVIPIKGEIVSVDLQNNQSSRDEPII